MKFIDLVRVFFCTLRHERDWQSQFNLRPGVYYCPHCHEVRYTR